MTGKNRIKLSTSREILYEIEESELGSKITNVAISDELELGLGSFIELSVSNTKEFAKSLYEIISPYIAARPSMELTIGEGENNISLVLKNVSEDLIAQSVERMISLQESEGS